MPLTPAAHDVQPFPFAGKPLECRTMAVIALRWFKAALVLQVLLLAYWLTTEVVDLFPWNDLTSRPADYNLRLSIAVNALQLLAYVGLFALGVRPLATFSALGYALFLGLQLWIWWKPYVMGANAEWQVRYAQAFAKTLKLLPTSGAHLAPDANHLTLTLLTLLTLLVTAMAVSRMQYL